MLTAERIRSLFEQLEQRLREAGKTGEIGIVGGAVMCLVYDARAATKDVDAIFEPASLIRQLAKEIGRAEGLPDDWLNDAAKAYIQGDFRRELVMVLPHLRVWAPEPRYMLAMKCISARWDTSDCDDVVFLIDRLRLADAASVLGLIEEYYPKSAVPARTRFLIEELFEE